MIQLNLAFFMALKNVLCDAKFILWVIPNQDINANLKNKKKRLQLYSA